MSEQDTATAAPAAEPAPAATTVEAPKPEEPKRETDWEAAYKGIQRNMGRLERRNDELAQLVQAKTDPLKSGVDTLLRSSLGEDGFKQHQEGQRIEAERQQALAASQAAQQFIPQSIAVIADTMRNAGVPEADIQSVFQSAAGSSNAAEWADAVKSGTKAVIDRAKAQETTKVEAQVTARNQDAIKAEAEAIAAKDRRAAGIDKVDLGKGPGSANKGFVSRVQQVRESINTPEGAAEYDKMLKEAKRGTLNI